MPYRNDLISEMKHEAAATRKLLERVPEESLGWKPHEKSMTLGRLASHVAEIPNWITVIAGADEFDFAQGTFKPHSAASAAELLSILDESVNAAEQALSQASDEDLEKEWTLKNGGHVMFTLPKLKVLRTWAYSHAYHHRGQLTVYLRLLDIPVPGMYGPSSDELEERMKAQMEAN